MWNINTLSSDNFNISNWTTKVAKNIYDLLEHTNWASWLEASINSIEWRAKVFPEWQFLLSNWKTMLWSLSTNCIYWDWNIDTLSSWDDIAWNPTTYENTYNPNWNALVLMSMNINPEFKWWWLTDYLVWAVKDLAKNKWIKYIIWSFRPSWYWEYKMENWNIPFEEYLNLKNEQWYSIDPWIRSLQKKWMQPLKIDNNAMIVEMDYESFLKLKEENWKEISSWVWECWQVWQFFIEWDKAIYKEKNLWWQIPLN